MNGLTGVEKPFGVAHLSLGWLKPGNEELKLTGWTKLHDGFGKVEPKCYKSYTNSKDDA
jgi:hypothetical protein